MLTQIRSLWNKWSPTQRMMLLGAAVLLVGAFGWLLQSGQSGPMAPLFTNLSPEDASSVVEHLNSTHVPHEVTAGGTVIVVPADKVHELRLELAGKGLPRGGGVGFEIFDEKTFGMSDFAQQLNYRRALMGELARTIGQLDSVDAARVHIVLPEKRLYTEREEPARASVTVRLRSGRRLGPGQVDAVVHLVASSVEGLAPEHVTVVDTHGTVLSRGGSEKTAVATLNYRREVEEDLERRVIAILERAVGSGKAVAQVAAEVDFSQVETTEESYDPETVAIRSEQTSDEKNSTTSPSTASSGAVGVGQNLAGPTATVTTSAPSGSGSRRTETRNYEITRQTSRQVIPSGQIKRVSIAALVDSAAGPGGAPVGAETLKQLEGLIRHAIGFNSARGDQVQLQAVRFAPIPEVEPPPSNTGAAIVRTTQSFLPYLLAFGALAVLYNLMRVARGKSAQPEPLITAPRTVRELEAAMARMPVHLPPNPPSTPIPPPLREPAQMAAAAGAAPAGQLAASARAIEEDSGRAAVVLRGWMGG